MEGLFSEHITKKVALRGDLDNQESSRISLKNAHKVALTISVPSVAENLPFTLRQHDAASSGNSKDLVVSNDYFYKLDADDEGTRVDAPNTAAVGGSELNGSAGLLTVEVLAEDLDVENGFAYVSIVVGDLAAARIGTIEAESHMPRSKPAYKVVL